MRLVLALLLLFFLVSNAAAESNKREISMTLEEYVDAALKKSLDIQTAEDNLRSAKWGWQQTRRNLMWPTLSASASGTKSFSDTDTGTETDTKTGNASVDLTQPLVTGTRLSVGGSWQASKTESDTLGVETLSRNRDLPDLDASISQPLYVFVRNPVRRSIRSADLGWENSQESYKSSKLGIEFQARTQYYDLLLLDRTTAVERKKHESAKLVNKVTKALVRAGKLAQVELTRANIRAQRDVRRIQNAENNLEKEKNEAKDFVLLPKEVELKLVSKLEFDPYTIPLERLLDMAMKYNPSIRQARRQIELSKLSLQSTKEGNRPTVNVNGNYSKTYDRDNDLQPLEPHSWNATMNLNWPLFDATQTRLQTRQGEISLKNTERSYEDQLRALNVSIENQFLEIKRGEDQIKNFDAQLKAGQKSLKAVRLQYKNGLTRLTDVFDAENEFRDLELEYLNLLRNYNVARDQMKVLVGIDPYFVIGGSNQ